MGVCVCVGTDFASATNLDLMALIHLSLSESLRAACNEIKVTSPLCLHLSLCLSLSPSPVDEHGLSFAIQKAPQSLQLLICPQNKAGEK